MQWIYVDTGSTPQQRSCLHREREGCSLLAWSSPPCCYFSRTSGLSMIFYMLTKLHHLFCIFLNIYINQLHFAQIYLTGEENDKLYPPVSSSSAEVYSHDGSSGSHHHFTEILVWGPNLLILKWQGLKFQLCTIMISGEKWKAILQASYWPCRGITPSCIYSYCRWSLPEIWKHIYASTRSFHKFERQVSLMKISFRSLL